MESFNQNILNDLKACFDLQTDDASSNANSVTLRSTFNTKEIAYEFLKKYAEITNTEWIVWRKLPSPQRLLFHQKWVCHHSQRHKVPNSSKRNTNCKASVDILIKKISKGTKQNDSFLRLSPPLQALIKLNMEHSHPTNSADSLRMLRVGEEVKQQFYKYFKDGMSPSEAIHFHESLLLRDEAPHNILANSAINPTSRQVYHLHHGWKQKNNECIGDPLEKLIEKSESYKNTGGNVFIKKDTPWAVLITTSVMKRAQELESTKDIIFVDTTASSESSGCALTVMLTPTKAGAIPIAVFIHQNQTAECYESAFALLKEHFPRCFAGNYAPAIFMTDDSAAEKSALQTTWPSCWQLLCHFYVAHAEWRYLWGSKIPDDKKPFLMHLFQKAMYSMNEEQFQYTVKEILELETQFPGFVKRFKEYLKREKEWVHLYRQHLITRNHNTNNFSEVTMRIIKDVILSQTKSFNVIALTEFCISIWDKYLVKKLSDFAHNRSQKSQLIYTSLSEKIDGSTFFVKSLNEYNSMYLIQSKGKKEKYTIDLTVGVCSCYAGKTGAFCKHQSFLHSMNQLILPNMPAATHVDLHALGKLALGEKCPSLSFFQGLKTEPPTTNNAVEMDVDGPTEAKMATLEDIGALENELKRITALCDGEFPQKLMHQMIKAMKRIRTKSQALSAFEEISVFISSLSPEPNLEQTDDCIINQYGY